MKVGLIMLNEINVEINNSKYWLVVYSKATGDFLNATTFSNTNEDTEKVSELFEQNNPGLLVIHIGEGEVPPKTYRSLQYVS